MLVALSFRFIEKFGTHLVVGVKMGGKDVIYLKQQHSSSLQPAVVQKRLKDMSDRRFLDANGHYDMSIKDAYGKDKVLLYSALKKFVFFALSCC
jgi:hypothetical protein